MTNFDDRMWIELKHVGTRGCNLLYPFVDDTRAVRLRVNDAIEIATLSRRDTTSSVCLLQRVKLGIVPSKLYTSSGAKQKLSDAEDVL